MGSYSFSQYAASSGVSGSGTATWSSGSLVTVSVTSNGGWRFRGANSSPYGTGERLSGHGNGTYSFNVLGDGDVIAFQVYCPVEETYSSGDVFTVSYGSSGGSSGGTGSPDMDYFNIYYYDNGYSWDEFYPGPVLMFGSPNDLQQLVKSPDVNSTQFTITGDGTYYGATTTTCTASKNDKTYYTFLGWSITPNGNVAYSPGEQYTGTYGTNLYAQQSSYNSTEYTGNTLASLTKPTISSTNTEFKLTYNANGGTISKSSDNITKISGHNFNYWCSNKDGTGTKYTDSSSFTSATTVYAVFSPTTSLSPSTIALPTATKADSESTSYYTITYNGNGGTPSKSSEKINKINKYNLSSWNTKSDGSGTSYNNTISTSNFNADTTLYAIFTPSVVSPSTTLSLPTATKENSTVGGFATITYNGNGGTPSRTSDSVSKIISYKFNSWNSNSDGTGIAYNGTVNSDRFNSDTTLYATYSIDSETISSVTLPTATRNGYNFKGWSTSPTSSEIVSNTYTPTNSVTLYAQWDVGNTAYTVNHYTKDLNATTYTLNKTETKYGSTDGSVTLSSLTISIANHTYKEGKVNNSVVTSTTILADGSRVINLYYTRNSYTVTLTKDSYISSVGFNGQSGTSMSFEYGSTVKLTATAATGSVFVNWTGDYTSTTRNYSFTMPTKNVNLTANGRYIKYTIKFDGNGSTSGSTSSVSMTYGTTKNLTTIGFTKTGCRFGNWNTKANGTGTSYSNGQSVKNLTTSDGATITLYAIWLLNTYTINFDGNGSTSGSTSSMSMTYDTAKNLTTNGFKKTDYNFIGWNTEPDGSGTSYNDGQSVKNLISTHNATITLYAQWELGTVKYQVIHNTKNLDGSSYSIYRTVDKYGLPDSTVNLNNIVESIDGFTYDHGKVDGSIVSSTTVLPDGSRVINLYYNRNKYNVSIDYDNKAISNVKGIGSYYYEETVTVSVSVNNGYRWDGWTGSHTSSNNPFTFTMTDNNVNLTANHIANKYNITFDGNGYDSGSTENMSGYYSSGTVLNTNGFALNGYEFVGWNTEPDGSGIYYKNSEDIANIATNSDITITLYAIWRSSGLVYLYNKETNEYDGYQMHISNGDNTWDLYTPYVGTGNNEYELY